MRSFSFTLSTVTVLTLLACTQSRAQTAPTLPPATDKSQSANTVEPPPLKPAPNLTDAQQELFLKTAKVLSQKTLEAGTTQTSKAEFSDGKLTHDVHIQCIDVFKPVWRGAEGTVERNFRDSWKFNVAAYKLARVLGINNVPVSVEREMGGKLCSVTWWVDNVWIVEAERRDKGIKPPATDAWVNQLNVVRVFDQLIYNMDRNQGNLLITPDWKLWMIDHTRAFRPTDKLPKPDNLRRIDKKLLDRLRTLNLAELQRELGPWLRAEEITALLGRRDAIVRYFEAEIREKGEDAVLTGIPRTTPAVSVP